MIPFNQWGLVRLFNKWSVRRSVKRVLAQYLPERIITITSVPNAADYVGLFKEKLILYFCVDEFSLWPGLDLHLVKKLEQELLSKTHRIIATSDSLARSKRVQNLETAIITHGVDFEHFNLLDTNRIVNRDQGQKIRCCYMGLFDERSDQHLILEFLEQNDDIEFHLVGKVVVTLSLLENHPRFYQHGVFAYVDLPSVLSTMDLLLLPYVRSELTNNINPLKLKEYLATGRPVLSTRLPEVVKFSEYIFLGDSASDFTVILKGLKTGQIIYEATKVKKYLRENETWHSKGKIFSGLVREYLQELA